MSREQYRRQGPNTIAFRRMGSGDREGTATWPREDISVTEMFQRNASLLATSLSDVDRMVQLVSLPSTRAFNT